MMTHRWRRVCRTALVSGSVARRWYPPPSPPPPTYHRLYAATSSDASATVSPKVPAATKKRAVKLPSVASITEDAARLELLALDAEINRHDTLYYEEDRPERERDRDRDEDVPPETTTTTQTLPPPSAAHADTSRGGNMPARDSVRMDRPRGDRGDYDRPRGSPRAGRLRGARTGVLEQAQQLYLPQDARRVCAAGGQGGAGQGRTTDGTPSNAAAPRSPPTPKRRSCGRERSGRDTPRRRQPNKPQRLPRAWRRRRGRRRRKLLPLPVLLLRWWGRRGGRL